MTLSETVRSTVTKDGVVLMDVSNGKIFSSNAVGARIWLKLQEGLDVEAIVAQVASEFRVSAEEIGPDVEEFVGKLKESGIVGERSCLAINEERQGS